MSLKEQMLKAGLIDEAQAKRAEQEKREKKKKSSHKQQEQERQKARQQVAKQAEAKREQDRQREQERQAQTRQQSVEKQEGTSIRQTVFRDGLLANWQGQKRYHFEEKGRVQFIDVSETVQQKLEQGRAAIARRPNTGQQYEVISKNAAEILKESQPELLIVFHDNA